MLSGAAWAQQDPATPLVESLGEATVYAQPAHVEFFLTKSFTDENIEKGFAAAKKFGEDLQARLGVQEIHTGEQEISSPTVADLKSKQVTIGVRLRFPMASFAPSDTGPELFARLCDKIQALADNFSATLTGPSFEPNDRDEMINSASVSATENAFPSGDAIAGALRSSILMVHKVTVREIVWNAPPNAKLPGPNLHQCSCTARVAVSYTVAPQP
jgi:hypothetical protein